jgi:tripartite-type tricarboxylate transporter receptor subunit TctC
MAGELFKLMAGVDLLHVPYRGAAPALTDLLGGRAQVMFESVTTLMPHIQAGKIRALAVTTPKRSPLLPDAPSIAEFLPGYDANTWFGIAAPKQTPADIVNLLNREINAGLKDLSVSKQLAELGTTPLAGTPTDFERIFVSDTAKWAKLIKAANIKQE